MTLRLQPRPAPLRGRVANSGGRWDRAQARAARGRGAVASLLGALAAADQPGAWGVHREAGGSSCARHPQAVAGGPLSPSAPCLGIQAGGRQLRSAPPKASRPSGRESSKRVRLPWREGPGRAWCVGTWDVERRGRGSGARSLPPAPRSRVRGFGLLLRRSTSPSYAADPSAQPPVWLCGHGPAGPLGEARRPPSASSSREPAPRGQLGWGRGRRARRGSGGAPSKGVGRQKRTQWVGFLWGGAQRGRGLGCSMDAP